MADMGYEEPEIFWNVAKVAVSKGITNSRDLAWRAHIFPSMMVTIWTGEHRQVKLVTLAKLAEALDCEISDLFTWKPPEEIPEDKIPPKKLHYPEGYDPEWDNEDAVS